MKRFFLAAMVLLICSSVAFGQSKRKSKSSSADTDVAMPDMYATDTAVPTQMPAAKPAATAQSDPAAQPSSEWTQNQAGYYSQDEVIDGVYKDENNVSMTVMPFPYIRQADVMWSKRILEEIDLSEKINRPLAHPNKRLISTLIEAVMSGELTAYANPEDGSDSIFRTVLTLEELSKICGGRTDTIQVPDIDDPYIMREMVVTENFNPELINKYRLKEDWIFDKQRSVLDPRIVGMAPCKLNISKTTGDTIGSTPMFWINYVEARPVLANAQMYNRFNDSSNMNFDDFFIKRMFSAYVIKESNTDNLRIQDYAVGMERLYESERIKRKIINFEQDLWEY